MEKCRQVIHIKNTCGFSVKVKAACYSKDVPAGYSGIAPRNDAVPNPPQGGYPLYGHHKATACWQLVSANTKPITAVQGAATP